MNTLILGALRPALLRRVVARTVTAAVALGLVASALVLTGTGTAHAAKARAGYAAMAASDYEKRVQRHINKERAQRGLPRLRLASCTDRVAERWATHLANNDAFYHQSMRDVLQRCHASYAGETLGRGAMRPARLVYLWMHSDGHRAVLLSPKARRIGIGSQFDRQGRWVTTANFMRF